jgi:hypothetical protein
MIRLPRTFHALIPFAIVATVTLPNPAGATVVSPISYDLVNDWSDAQNPNGAWSYNYNDTPIGINQAFWWGGIGWGNNSLGDGAIMKGSYPTGVPDPFSGIPLDPPHDWVPGDVMMHALSIPYGGGSTFLNVTWTSPADGMISISGRAWDGEIYSDRDVAWSLMVGGQAIAGRSSTYGLYRNDAAAQFSSNLFGNNSLNNIPVTQGETVEFLVATDTYYGHFVGVQETITLVPEPGAASLLTGGAIVFCLIRRLARK